MCFCLTTTAVRLRLVGMCSFIKCVDSLNDTIRNIILFLKSPQKKTNKLYISALLRLILKCRSMLQTFLGIQSGGFMPSNNFPWQIIEPKFHAEKSGAVWTFEVQTIGPCVQGSQASAFYKILAFFCQKLQVLQCKTP